MSKPTLSTPVWRTPELRGCIQLIQQVACLKEVETLGYRSREHEVANQFLEGMSTMYERASKENWLEQAVSIKWENAGSRKKTRSGGLNFHTHKASTI